MNHILIEESKTHRRCTQTQCLHYVNGGCQVCEDCHAAPFVLTKTCDRCLDCEGVPNALRWGPKRTSGVRQLTPPARIEEDPDIVGDAMRHVVGLPPLQLAKDLNMSGADAARVLRRSDHGRS